MNTNESISNLPIIPICLESTTEADLVLRSDSKFKPISTSWIQIAKLGEFKGHSAGSFSLTSEVFDSLIKNFSLTENQAIPIDYEHASEMPPYLGSIPEKGSPAVGWITRLSNRQKEGLWGFVEWVDQTAVDYIRQGKYRFFSPAITLQSKDPVTGKPNGQTLTSGALTNKPFLDGMQPLTASNNSQSNQSNQYNQSLNFSTVTKKESNQTMSEQNQSTLPVALLSKLSVILGLGLLASQSEDQVLASVQANKEKLIKAESDLKQAQSELTETKSQLENFKKLEADRVLANAKNQVKKLVDFGIIEKEGTDSAVEVCLSNPKAFDSLFAKKLQESEAKTRQTQTLLTSQLVPQSGVQTSVGSKDSRDSLLLSKIAEIQKVNPEIEYFEAMAKAVVEIQSQ